MGDFLGAFVVRADRAPELQLEQTARRAASREVHAALAEVIYLVTLDEHRDEIESAFGVGVRRASATVLVGHPGCHPDVAEKEIDEVFRILSTNPSRIEVRTDQELLDSAERTLDPTDRSLRR